MKKATPVIGALFAVTLPDGSHAVGQIVDRVPAVLNSWTCAFSGFRVGRVEELLLAPLEETDVISVQFVAGDLLKDGTWKIFGAGPVRLPLRVFPFEDCRSRGWVGAKIIGSKNVGRFLAAFHGLEYWDGMKDPEYYAKLLLPGVVLPSNVRRRNAELRGF
jgi:hypothetical protein